LNDNIRFDVEFYDGHEQQLRSIRAFPALQRMTKNGLVIPYGEFKAYAIFREQGLTVGYRNYNELQQRLSMFIPAYEAYYARSGDVIYLQRGHDKQQGRPQTEMGGIGAALSIVSQAYELTEADWQRIPESRRRDLDFQYTDPPLATDGKGVIFLEAKAHATDQRRISLASDASSIGKKKNERRGYDVNSEFIGVVTSFFTDLEQYPSIRLLDPPSIPFTDDPRKLRIIKRLYFYWRALTPISGSSMLIALINRIYDIASGVDYDSLDDQPLLDRRGDRIEDSTTLGVNRTHVRSLQAIGEVIGLDNGTFFFYGFDVNVINTILAQRFESILSYRFGGLRGRSIVDGVAAPFTARIGPRNLPPTLKEELSGRVEVTTEGVFQSNSAGRIYGQVHLNANDLQRTYRRRSNRPRGQRG